MISNRANPGDVIANTASLESPDASIHVSNNAPVTILPGSLPATGQSVLSVLRIPTVILSMLASLLLIKRRRLSVS